MQMSGVAVALLLLSVASVEANVSIHTRLGRTFLGVNNDLQPEVVAQTFVQVENKWRVQAKEFNECISLKTAEDASTTCEAAETAFHESCGTVFSAMVQGSDGERARVVEYMDDVCSEKELSGWRAEGCRAFSSLITSAMGHNALENRKHLKSGNLCNSFWAGLLEKEKAWAQHDHEEAQKRAEDEQKRKEEEAKKALEEQKRKEEEEARKQAEEAAAEAQKRKEEEEAQKKAAEEAAKKLAEESKKEAAQKSANVTATKPGTAFLVIDGADSLQPQVVAHTLVRIEKKWHYQARAFTECNALVANGAGDSAACLIAQKAFAQSCDSIVSSVIESSNGDRRKVVEYLSDVCGEDELRGLKQETCHVLASHITNAMENDAYKNREHLNRTVVCDGLWSNFTKRELDRAQQQQARHAAEEQKLAEQHAEEERLASIEAKDKLQQDQTLAHATDIAKYEMGKEERDASQEKAEQAAIAADEKQIEVARQATPASA